MNLIYTNIMSRQFQILIIIKILIFCIHRQRSLQYLKITKRNKAFSLLEFALLKNAFRRCIYRSVFLPLKIVLREKEPEQNLLQITVLYGFFSSKELKRIPLKYRLMKSIYFPKFFIYRMIWIKLIYLPCRQKIIIKI